MLHRRSLRTSLLTIAFFFIAALTAPAQERVYKHTVQAGETLYRLSVDYGTTVEDIVRLNPALEKEGLKAGQVIAIPAVSHKDGVAGSDCRTMHKVKRKETLWGISQQYGLTIDEMLRANPDVKSADDVKKGSFLCIPYAKDSIIVQEPVFNGYKHVNVAVVLPMLDKSTAASRCVEFYRGFLMAVDKAKEAGDVNITVSAFNEPSAATSASAVIEKVKRTHPHLVIGPLYPQHFQAFASLPAHNDSTNWLLPFSSKYEGIGQSPRTYVLNAPDSYKAQYVTELLLKTFTKPHVVFLQETDGNEQEFTRLLETGLKAQKCSTQRVQAGYTADQLRQLLSDKRLTLFVPSTSTKAGAEKTMQLLAKLRETAPQGNFALLAYPEWTEDAKISENRLRAVNTYVFTNSFYEQYGTGTRRFVADYERWFNAKLLDVTPRMALLGYDAGTTFINALRKYGYDFTNQKAEGVTTYQSDIHFAPTLEGGGYVNHCTYFIHYSQTAVEKITF